MRVLFLFPRPLDARTSGGVAEFLYSLTPLLNDLDVEPVIYAGDKALSKLTGPVSLPGKVSVYSGPFLKPGWFVSRRRLAPVLELCRQTKIDVVHAQGTYTAGFLAMQIRKQLHIPYVVTSHNDILETNSRRMKRWNVKQRCRNVLKHASIVTHLTSIMEDASHRLLDTREKSVTIGNGIDCSAWQAYAGLPEQDYLLGIGRLERGKGFHILLDMYPELLARGVTTSLVIAGKGNAEKELHDQARKLGLNLITDFSDYSQIPEKSVIFTGYVRGEAKQRLIAQSKCILFPTQPSLWEEAFSIAQLEAMAAGKAMIASDTAATRYLQSSGLQALVVEPENVNAWAGQALLLLRDNDLRRQSGMANLRAASQFDWRPIARQYRDVYARASRS
jgi:glycosyltransferase involved in cell wall biosynthesis